MPAEVEVYFAIVSRVRNVATHFIVDSCGSLLSNLGWSCRSSYGELDHLAGLTVLFDIPVEEESKVPVDASCALEVVLSLFAGIGACGKREYTEHRHEHGYSPSRHQSHPTRHSGFHNDLQ